MKKFSLWMLPVSVATGLALVSGSGCSEQGTTRTSMSVTDPDPVTEVHTVINSDPKEDLGVIKWRESAEVLMREIPMQAYSLSPEGYLVSFSPAMGAVSGVEEPPLDTPLKYVAFNKHGEVAGWEAYDNANAEDPTDPAPPACSIRRIQTTDPALPPLYVCINNSCTTPKKCVVTYRYNEDGTLKEVTCDCIVVSVE